MATLALPLNAWNLEYYQTMAAAERARLNVAKAQQHAAPRTIRLVAEACLWYPFHAVTRETENLVSLLEKFETYPAYVLLEEDVEKMPQELHELVKKMCVVIRLTETAGLRYGHLLRKNITRLAELSQQINGFAVRFEDAQNKLRSRIPAEQVQNFQEAFAAYGSCVPAPEQATDDDVKSELLHF